MNELLKPIIRVWWWFTGNRLKYHYYYKIARMVQGQLDPRAVRRAHLKAGIVWVIGILLSLEVGLLVLELKLNFDPMLGPYVGNAISVIALIPLTITYAMADYSNIALGQLIRADFFEAWKDLAIALLVTSFAAGSVEGASRRDTTNLPNEEGTQRWGTPDELIDSRGSLLPDGYDVFFGFDHATKVAMRRSRDRIAVALNTSRASTLRRLPWYAMLAMALVTPALLATPHPSLPDGIITIAAFVALGYFGRAYLNTPPTLVTAAAGALIGGLAGAFMPHDAAIHRLLVGSGVGAFLAIVLALSLRLSPPSLTRASLIIAGIVPIVATITGLALHQPLWVFVTFGIASAIIAIFAPERFTLVFVGILIAAGAGYLLSRTSHAHVVLPTLIYLAATALASCIAVVELLMALPREKSTA